MRLSNRSGFTLIELLVVIAIIAILAGILFPVFLAAKEHSLQTRCLSNLKNLSTGILLYADDYQGTLPSAAVRKDRWASLPQPWPADWCGNEDTWKPVHPEKSSIWGYIGRNRALYLCPSDKGKIAPNWQSGDASSMHTAAEAKAFPLSYSMNTFLHRLKVSASRIRNTSKMLLLIHEDRNTINDGLFHWGWRDQHGNIVMNMDVPDSVHYTGTTVVYLDGHAAWKPHNVLIKERDARYWEAWPVWPDYAP